MLATNDSISCQSCSFMVNSYPNAGPFEHQKRPPQKNRIDWGGAWLKELPDLLVSWHKLFSSFDVRFWILPFYWHGLLWWMIFGILSYWYILAFKVTMSCEWKPAICWQALNLVALAMLYHVSLTCLGLPTQLFDIDNWTCCSCFLPEIDDF